MEEENLEAMDAFVACHPGIRKQILCLAGGIVQNVKKDQSPLVENMDYLSYCHIPWYRHLTQ